MEMNALEVVNLERWSQESNTVAGEVAFKWGVEMQKQMAAGIPLTSDLIAKAGVAARYEDHGDIGKWKAVMCLIRNWKHRESFACLIGCPARLHDVLQEEKLRTETNPKIVQSKHNKAAEIEVINEKLSHTK